ncbi:PspC domain-containing protein [Fundicoccus culcitae]|uniref:PspC domain-containing protein n=1 Tax=Fundicoccus culcitae TaxID=2969821 RepID=A0ABY5P3D3_9LACT|nr:PspC domain-containing protein [Fundicoccus culcitae]UUX32925.1 PspC domain-containing protein [Fundicoccus culcitae]
MKRLRLSQNNKVILGVCGGLGEYFNVDPVIVRVIFVLLAFMAGLGPIAYLIIAVVMSSNENR